MTNAFGFARTKIEAMPETNVLRVIYGAQIDALAAQATRPLSDDERGIVAAQTIAAAMMTQAMTEGSPDLAADAFTMLTQVTALVVIDRVTHADPDAPETARTPDDDLLTALWARTVARDN